MLAQNVVKRVYPRSSECVVKVHYHDHSNIVKNTREADPDMFKVQSQNYLEGPFSLIGDFAYPFPGRQASRAAGSAHQRPEPAV